MKIAMVSEHASPLEAPGGIRGGGEQNVHVGELATALAEAGHAVTVYTRRADADARDSVDTDDGYRLEHVPGGPAEPVAVDAHLPLLPEFASRLGERLTDDPPDIVHAHYWTSGMVCLAATKNTDLPVVQTFHSLGVTARRHPEAHRTGPPGRPRMERVIASSAARTIATSEAQMVELVRMGVARRSVSVVPTGVDTGLFAPGPPPADGPPRLVSLGRLVPQKGFDLLIRALRRVPGVELWIGGDGPENTEAARLQRIAEQLGIADRVRLLGPVARADVPALLRSARIVAATPWYASFGLVPLEAMACGVPVLASAVGGHLDTVVDGVTGVLLPPGRSDLLAVALNRLLDDPVQLDAFGVAGADRARSRYSWRRIAADTARIYQTVLGMPPPEAAEADDDEDVPEPDAGDQTTPYMADSPR